MGCTIFDLTQSTCRWPLWRKPGEAQRFCGCRVKAPKREGDAPPPYCPEHCDIAFVPPLPRSKRPHRKVVSERW